MSFFNNFIKESEKKRADQLMAIRHQEYMQNNSQLNNNFVGGVLSVNK